MWYLDFSPQKTYARLQDERMTRTIVITENVNSKWRILPRNTHFSQIFKSQWLRNRKELSYLQIVKNWTKSERYVNIQKYWIIWHGIIQNSSHLLKLYHTNFNAENCYDFVISTFRLVESYKSYHKLVPCKTPLKDYNTKLS